MSADRNAELPEDPFLEAELDRALEPYRDLLSPEMLQDFRELLGDVLTTHPTASRVLDRTRPRVSPQRSGEGTKESTASTETGEGGVAGRRRG